MPVQSRACVSPFHACTARPGPSRGVRSAPELVQCVPVGGPGAGALQAVVQSMDRMCCMCAVHA